ncbi:MAG: tetratricopeptide repeat protein [Gemmatimonadales bacterium]|jgi:tetratricopeptide (TPR) repeat protein
MTGSQLSTWWDTIRQARLFRVLAVYVGASFAVIQLVDILTNQLGLPDWFFPGALALLLIGLPIVVTTALVQSSPRSRQAAPGAEAAATDSPAATTAADAGGVAKPWLTWRRAIVGGALAFVLLGVAVAGYMAMRALGIGPIGSLVAAGVLDERDRIILADFQGDEGDAQLAATATEAFRIDLAQSPLVRLVDPTYLGHVLARMEREPTTSLDPALAREVAIRDGVKAIIAGAINAAGTGFVLSAELVSAESGEVLAAYRETARDSTAVIDAIDRLSRSLRERIGESLVSIRGNEPLQAVTTSSLEALRKYSQAVRAAHIEGDFDRGIALYEEAVAIDSTFAMAWRQLGVDLGIRGETERSRQAVRRAYEYRDRLTDRERYLTIGTYHYVVTEDLEEGISAYRTLLDTYPDDHTALNNLGYDYLALRDYAQAEEMLLRAIEADPYSSDSHWGAIGAAVAQGEFAAAESTLVRFAEHLPDNPATVFAGNFLASARGDYEIAEAQVQALREQQRASPTWQAWTSGTLSALATVRGRLAEAEGYQRDALATNESRGLLGLCVSDAIGLAYLDLWFRGRVEPAVDRAEAALSRCPLDSIPPAERPYGALVSFYANAQRPERAATYLADYEESVDAELRRTRSEQSESHTMRGNVAMAEGRIDDAIAEYRLADRGICQECALYELAAAYDLAGEPDSAIAAYERRLEKFWLLRVYYDSFQLAPTYERLASLYEARGDTQKAIHYYGKLIELWENADPDLQPRVESARRAIEALASER